MMENQNSRGKHKSKGTLRSRLNAILEEFARKRVNGDTASHSTATTMGQVLQTCFADIDKLGFRLEDPKNLGGKPRVTTNLLLDSRRLSRPSLPRYSGGNKCQHVLMFLIVFIGAAVTVPNSGLG